MVHCVAVSGGEAMDFTRGARSGIASHLRRMFWRGNFFAGGGWVPAGGVGLGFGVRASGFGTCNKRSNVPAGTYVRYVPAGTFCTCRIMRTDLYLQSS